MHPDKGRAAAVVSAGDGNGPWSPTGRVQSLSAYVPGPPGTGLQMLTEKTFGKAATTRTWDSLKKVARETRSTRAG